MSLNLLCSCTDRFCHLYVYTDYYIFTALWTFLWFVGFCYMTDAWRRSEEGAPYIAPNGYGKDHVQAAIAFSFFSIITWVCLG